MMALKRLNFKATSRLVTLFIKPRPRIYLPGTETVASRRRSRIRRRVVSAKYSAWRPRFQSYRTTKPSNILTQLLSNSAGPEFKTSLSVKIETSISPESEITSTTSSPSIVSAATDGHSGTRPQLRSYTRSKSTSLLDSEAAFLKVRIPGLFTRSQE
ncbi:hypothetical protein BDW22DRAFT_4130 [Trametopsis cervina]|nr:hypothetical protein BDW22DRAFT_4130 [Trametopsis cervina]